MLSHKKIRGAGHLPAKWPKPVPALTLCHDGPQTARGSVLRGHRRPIANGAREGGVRGGGRLLAARRETRMGALRPGRGRIPAVKEPNDTESPGWPRSEAAGIRPPGRPTANYEQRGGGRVCAAFHGPLASRASHVSPSDLPAAPPPWEATSVTSIWRGDVAIVAAAGTWYTGTVDDECGWDAGRGAGHEALKVSSSVGLPAGLYVGWCC
jgi:hypothetical protein